MVERRFWVLLNVEEKGRENGGVERVYHSGQVGYGTGATEHSQNVWEPEAIGVQGLADGLRDHRWQVFERLLRNTIFTWCNWLPGHSPAQQPGKNRLRYLVHPVPWILPSCMHPSVQASYPLLSLSRSLSLSSWHPRNSHDFSTQSIVMGPSGFYMMQVRVKPKCQSLTRVWLFATPWTVTWQAPLPIEFSRQEYWSGLPFPSPADLPNPGIDPGSPTLQEDSLLSDPPGKSLDVSK